MSTHFWSQCAADRMQIGSRLLYYTIKQLINFKWNFCEWTSKNAFSLSTRIPHIFLCGLVTSLTTTISRVAIRNQNYWHQIELQSTFSDWWALLVVVVVVFSHRSDVAPSVLRIKWARVSRFPPSALKMSGPKWLPKDLQNSYHLFSELSRAAATFKWLTNRYLSEINLNVPDLYVSMRSRAPVAHWNDVINLIEVWHSHVHTIFILDGSRNLSCVQIWVFIRRFFFIWIVNKLLHCRGNGSNYQGQGYLGLFY